MTNSKMEYVQPQLNVLGSFETLTQGAKLGSKLDSNYTTGTTVITGVTNTFS